MGKRSTINVLKAGMKRPPKTEAGQLAAERAKNASLRLTPIFHIGKLKRSFKIKPQTPDDKRAGLVITCNSCPAEDTYHTGNRSPTTPNIAFRVFTHRHWRLGASHEDDLCPVCSGNGAPADALRQEAGSTGEIASPPDKPPPPVDQNVISIAKVRHKKAAERTLLDEINTHIDEQVRFSPPERQRWAGVIRAMFRKNPDGTLAEPVSTRAMAKDQGVSHQTIKNWRRVVFNIQPASDEGAPAFVIRVRDALLACAADNRALADDPYLMVLAGRPALTEQVIAIANHTLTGDKMQMQPDGKIVLRAAGLWPIEKASPAIAEAPAANAEPADDEAEESAAPPVPDTSPDLIVIADTPPPADPEIPATTLEEPAPMTKPTTLRLPAMPPAAKQDNVPAAAATAATPQQNHTIRMTLNIHYPEIGEGYLNEMTDAKVAAELQMPVAWIADIRAKLCGPEFVERLSPEERAIAALREEIAAVEDRLLTEMTQTLAPMRAKLDELAAAVALKTGARADAQTGRA